MDNQVFVAKTYQGIEQLLCEELQELGAKNPQVISRGVRFEGDFPLMYKINYFSRLSLRILWQVHTFTFDNNNQFYKEIFNFPSENYLSKSGKLAVSATIHNSIFNTPLFASVLAKDAICDRFREKYGERPSVDKEAPDVQYHLHIYNKEATLFLDSSGESLHKRGYKVSTHPAPINEVVAAAMIKLSGWHGECDFIDFMCGSGTLLIEAAMVALNIPAGFYREHYGFFSWLNFDKELWEEVQLQEDIKEDVPIDFYGSDISARYLGMARVNIEEANLSDFIRLFKKDLTETLPKRTPAFVMINPPYDERLEVEDLDALYRSIGDTLKRKYAGCTAFIISSDFRALKSVGLHPSKKYTLYNGQLECKFMKFDLYEGGKKALHTDK